MDATDTFLADLDAFTEVVDATPDWSAASACEEWSAADVVDHVVDTQRGFLTEQGADLGERPDGDGAAVWHAHVDGVRQALARDGFAETSYDGFLGPTTVGEHLATFFGFDLLVHRWDLAQASGRPVDLSDAQLDGLEAMTDRLGEMLYSSGASKPPLDVPADAPRRTRVLARLGRAG